MLRHRQRFSQEQSRENQDQSLLTENSILLGVISPSTIVYISTKIDGKCLERKRGKNRLASNRATMHQRATALRHFEIRKKIKSFLKVFFRFLFFLFCLFAKRNNRRRRVLKLRVRLMFVICFSTLEKIVRIVACFFLTKI